MYPTGEFTEFLLRSYPPMIGLPPVEDAAGLPATAQQLFAAGTPLVAIYRRARELFAAAQAPT